MVHALSEIHRVLKPDGVLIDLRPIVDAWAVEVVSATAQETGMLEAESTALEDDHAAEEAMREVESLGWFVKKQARNFSYNYYWDTPSEMKSSVENDWQGIAILPKVVHRKTSALWASAGAEARVRIRMQLHIAEWQKK